jgi:hypothetical protein
MKIAGPVGAFAAAAYAHYEVRKKDDEIVGKVLRGVGDTVVGGVELIKKVDSKFEVVREVEKVLLGAVTTTYGNDKETMENFKKTMDSLATKVGEEIIPAIVEASDAALEVTDSMIASAEKMVSPQSGSGISSDSSKK